MEKRELFRIGEVSRLFHISVGTLRHYEKIGLMSPEYTDPDTGYRYYSTRQFECLNMIRYLRALDTPLERIAVFLGNRNVDSIHGLLQRQKDEVARRRQELSVIERKIENRLSQIEEALSCELDVISLEKRPARRMALLKKSLMPQNYLDLEHSIRELEQSEENTVIFLGKVGLGLSEKALERRQFRPYELVFILLDEEDSFRGDTVLLPEETCLTLRFQGGHDQAPGYYERLMDYMEEQHYGISGFSREITMIDYGLTNDVTKFVTEIQIPVVLHTADQ
ncbi:MerR family transcriptional regulator [bacterium 1XD42-94]|nr:MerR family transcriptional regulator [bacterium 1XD42-76]NBK05979.1 MerR family transcriptional regulator [bacterium 1XD42-94]